MAATTIWRKATGLTLGLALLLGAGAGAGPGAAQAGPPNASSAAVHRPKVTPPKLPAVCPNAGLAPTASNLVAIGRATICLINKERVARGLVALAENSRLDRAAVLHSDSMVAHGYFNDVGPGSQTVQQRTLITGYARAGRGYRVGENIAIGTGGAGNSGGDRRRLDESTPAPGGPPAPVLSRDRPRRGRRGSPRISQRHAWGHVHADVRRDRLETEPLLAVRDPRPAQPNARPGSRLCFAGQS